MIVLDTTVVSEPMRPEPDLAVVSWLDRQDARSLFITAVTVGEMLLGAELLPAGKRKSTLSRAIDKVVGETFRERILDFDTRAASELAVRMASARRSGIAVEMSDGQIAGIAAARGFAVATRDVAPFSALGLAVIDPWTDEPPPG